TVAKQGDYPVYIDLRSVGSNGSIYNDSSRPLAERASTLIVDVLNALYNELYSVALTAIETAQPDQIKQITIRLDDVSTAIQSVRITGSVEEERQSNESVASERTAEATARLSTRPSLDVGAGRTSKASTGESWRKRRSGNEIVHLNFGTIGSSLSGLVGVLGSPRLWIMLDEWSEVPLELQPYLADLLRRTVLPVNAITVKIAAIEHRSNFTTLRDQGDHIGLE